MYAKSNSYNLFLKELENDPELAEEYANTPRGLKQAERLEHFQHRGEVASKAITAIIRLTISDWSEAEWLTPRQLNKQLGDDPEATVNWIRSCIEMGPSQYKLNVLCFELDLTGRHPVSVP